MSKQKRWTMPKWMEEYKFLFLDPQRVEEFMNCDGKNCNIVVNGPRALICQGVQSEVMMLIRLKAARKLL